MSESPEAERTVAEEAAELESLANAANPAALRRLREALNSDSPLIRQVAATSLGRMANSIAAPYLIDKVNDPVSEVRRAVIWALGQIRTAEAFGAIRSAAGDPDEDVRRAAAWALAGAASKHSDGARQRPRTRRWLVVVAALLGVIGLGAVTTAAILWQQPLGPALVALDEGTESATPTSVPVSDQPACGSAVPVMNVLVMGLDSQGYYAGFADVIRVARIDFTRPGIILLGIPRDLWVSIPGLAHEGINEDRLRMAYPYGNVKQVPGGGPSLMAQTLTFNMGLRIDRYAATDFKTFESVIDEIGGIDIYLPEAVGNETTDPPVFPAGWNHMDGAAALRFSRVRPENSSDLERMDRQNQVISAIRARLTSSDLLPRIPALVDQVRGSIATDLSPAELSALVCVAQQVPPDDMSIVRIDKPLVLSVTDEFGHERLLPDQDGIREFVRAFNAGDVDAMRILVQK